MPCPLTDQLPRRTYYAHSYKREPRGGSTNWPDGGLIEHDRYVLTNSFGLSTGWGQLTSQRVPAHSGGNLARRTPRSLLEEIVRLGQLSMGASPALALLDYCCCCVAVPLCVCTKAPLPVSLAQSVTQWSRP